MPKDECVRHLRKSESNVSEEYLLMRINVDTPATLCWGIHDQMRICMRHCLATDAMHMVTYLLDHTISSIDTHTEFASVHTSELSSNQVALSHTCMTSVAIAPVHIYANEVHSMHRTVNCRYELATHLWQGHKHCRVIIGLMSSSIPLLP